MVAQTLEGRDYEVGAIRNAIEAAATHSASISIVGTAGIGKSTLIDVAIGTAHGAGFRVLESRPAASEVRLSFVGLTDLLLPLEDARALLPRAQREALRVAFGEEVRGDGFPVSTRLVAAATLGALEHAGQEKPIMLVVDDLQWLDEQSYEAVRFAVRRCNGRLVAVSAMRLASSDDVPDRALESRSARQLDLLALAESEILAIVRATSDQPMALGIARRIAELAGGNPFYAVELAHAVEQIGRMPDSLPTTLQQVVSARISGLSQPAREAVQIASAMPDPRVEDLLRINPAKPLALGIAEAESAKVVELRHGSVRFEHPLLARGAYESIAPADRRLLHSALASIARNVEERARHLAHSVTHADPGVLDEIDAAAATARRAGRSGVAAELEDAAISLGDRDPARLLRSATDHFHADGYARALRLLDDALEQTEEPDIRSKALGLIGAIRFRMGDLVGAATALTSAVGLASDDCRARGSLLVELACVLLNSGRLKEAVSAADSAREDAEAANDDGLTAEALGCHALVHLLHGDTLRTADIDRARNLEDTRLDSHALRWPAVNAAAIWLVTGDVRRARPALASARLRCLERGNEADLWFLDYHSVGPALQVGDLASARSHAKEVASQAEASGSEALKAMGLVALARVDLWAGNISLAETRSRKALTAFARISATVPQSMAAAVLCPALLLLGRSSEAADLSREISAILGAAGYQHPGFSISPGDHVDALLAIRATDEARECTDSLARAARLAPGVWLSGLSLRAHALLDERDGRMDRARSGMQDALDTFADPSFGYERGRTLLALARLERRARRRGAARESINRAIDEFDDVAAHGWTTAARAELEWIADSRGARQGLTPMEERVCVLSAGGLTNANVAVQLGISVKTVEAHLARAYRKLSIGSRAELGRWHAQRPAGEAPPL